MKSKFIIIEGIDGSGKTTIAENLNSELNRLGYNSVFVNKKDTSYCSEYIQRFMGNIRKSLWENSPSDPVSEVPEEGWLYLHSLWYKMMEEMVIKKLLNKYDFVIMDGWYFKFLARHLVNVEFDFQFTYSIVNRFIQGDYTFFLDIEPENCFKRRTDFKPSELGAHEISNKDMENTALNKFIKYQSKVRNEYLKFCDLYNFKNIDTNGVGIDEVINKITKIIIGESNE